jgi:hypothetical protein
MNGLMQDQNVPSEVIYGIFLTGTAKEVEMMNRVLKELKKYAFIDEDMEQDSFFQDCFQRGYNEYLKELSNYLEDM